jgi:ATP-dependent RNA helicase DeaD
MADAEGAPDGDEDIATPTLPPDRPEPPRDGRRRAGPTRGGGAPPGPRGPGPKRGRLSDAMPTTRIFVGAGRAAGIRPADLVGAIANEAGLAGDRIGSIQIAEGFSLVEVPEADAERVIGALRAGSIKGRRVNVRRERY